MYIYIYVYIYMYIYIYAQHIYIYIFCILSGSSPVDGFFEAAKKTVAVYFNNIQQQLIGWVIWSDSPAAMENPRSNRWFSHWNLHFFIISRKIFQPRLMTPDGHGWSIRGQNSPGPQVVEDNAKSTGPGKPWFPQKSFCHGISIMLAIKLQPKSIRQCHTMSIQ